MITCPDDWLDRPSGRGLILLPRDEEVPGCVILYQERVIPQRSLWALVNETLTFDADFKVSSESSVDCFLTDEGEYAAMICISGTVGSKPAAHVIGAVFAEDFSTLIDARILDMARVESYQRLVFTLMRQDRLCLGVRRRRVLFIPPSDWHAVASGLGTALYPPDYPRTLSYILVSPTEPHEGGEIDIVALRNREDARRGISIVPGADKASSSFTTQHSLHCEMSRTTRRAPDGTVVVRDLVVLRDALYLYTMHLEATQHDKLEAHRELFMMLADSVRPIRLAVGQPRDRVKAAALRSDATSPLGTWDD